MAIDFDDASFDAQVASCYADLYNQLSDDNYAADYNLYASMKAASDDVVLFDAGFDEPEDESEKEF